MKGQWWALAILVAACVGTSIAEDEVRLADTNERLTAAEEETARQAVYDNGPTVTSWERDRPRALVVPKEVQRLYREKPRATVRLLLKIVDGGRPSDSIHGVTCIEALVDSPEMAAVTAMGASDKTWDDVIGGANPLTSREHFRQLCVRSISQKENGKPGRPAERKLTRLDKVDSFPVAQREAAKAVAASITESKESPTEFFAEAAPDEDGRILAFHLWHKSALEPRNRDVLGNPGGKCRDIHYDLKERKVTQSLLWQ